MSDYKNLNLNRETLDVNIHGFLKSNNYTLAGDIQQPEKRKRVVFGAMGTEFATVDLYLNGTGTTTIQWKMGKNQPVSGKFNPDHGVVSGELITEKKQNEYTGEILAKKKQNEFTGEVKHVSDDWMPRKSSVTHPYKGLEMAIVGRITNAKRDVYWFKVSGPSVDPYIVSSLEMVKAGYSIFPFNDCSVKVFYRLEEFFINCGGMDRGQLSSKADVAL